MLWLRPTLRRCCQPSCQQDLSCLHKHPFTHPNGSQTATRLGNAQLSSSNCHLTYFCNFPKYYNDIIIIMLHISNWLSMCIPSSILKKERSLTSNNISYSLTLRRHILSHWMEYAHGLCKSSCQSNTTARFYP